MPDLPNGTITFLFTDIEGSTRLWEQYPEAMRLALARHDALMGSAIEQHGGVVFKTIGDSFCAAFHTAPEALETALIAQQALLSEPWPEPVTIRVRMALHTGAAELRDNDYFGQPLNRVARLLEAGHGGQVLISAATQALIHDTLPPAVSLKEMGEHRLRDLNRPEPVFQLLYPDLPAEFPPLKSLDQFPNNLPLRLTSFIGREKEMAEIGSLLKSARLLTLTGSGGCGKTRLSLQAAADVLEQFSDGVWLVELAPLSDPALLPQTVASVLGVTEQAGKTLLQTLLDYLRPRRLLLVLDNCEHLISPCASLADALLQSCPGLKILSTSRQPLGIYGEQTWRVPSLSLPEVLQPADKGDSSLLGESEAVRLFVERAHGVSPDLWLEPDDLQMAAQICRRLDGIALAIELAAARTRTVSLPEINSRLDDQFRLLTGGSRTALPRHQTLRALIDWSYLLLDARERTLLRRLAVFSSGWTLVATEAICADRDESAQNLKEHEERSIHQDKIRERRAKLVRTEDATFLTQREGRKEEARSSSLTEGEILDLLTSLVDKSLVLVERQRNGIRFRLLETVRQYALERLKDVQEDQATRHRHFQWYLQLAVEADKHLNGKDQLSWLDRLDAEKDNLRAALFWGLHPATCEGEEFSESGHCDERSLETLLLAAALTTYWSLRGYYMEGRAALEEALTRADSSASPEDYANALNGLGTLATSQGDYVAAKTALERSLAIHRELGYRRGVAGTLHNLGNIAYYQGDLTQAHALWKQALHLNRELGNQSWEANNLGCLGNAAYTAGDYAEAKSLWEQARDLHRMLGNRAEEANILNNLGFAYVAQGDSLQAQAIWEGALVTAREIGFRNGEAYSLGNLAKLACDRGEYAVAQALEEESLQIHREIGNRRDVAGNLARLGRLARQQGKYVQARLLLEQALALNREIGNRTWVAEVLVGLGEIACLLDDQAGAADLGREALTLMHRIGMKGEIPTALELLAKTWAMQGDGLRAIQLRAAATALRESVGKSGPSDPEANREYAGLTTPLDPEAFQREWKRGSVLSLEQAIELAVETR